MSWINKPWGMKQTIMETDAVIVDHLVIKPGGYSSIHQHKFLHNRFYVIGSTDKLEIQIFEVEEQIKDITTSATTPGIRQYERVYAPNPVDHITVAIDNNSIAVPPKIWHRFRNPLPSQIQVIEVSYLASISIEDDIFRIPGFEKGGHGE